MAKEYKLCIASTVLKVPIGYSKAVQVTFDDLLSAFVYFPHLCFSSAQLVGSHKHPFLCTKFFALCVIGGPRFGFCLLKETKPITNQLNGVHDGHRYGLGAVSGCHMLGIYHAAHAHDLNNHQDRDHHYGSDDDDHNCYDHDHQYESDDDGDNHYECDRGCDHDHYCYESDDDDDNCYDHDHHYENDGGAGEAPVVHIHCENIHHMMETTSDRKV